MIDLYDADERIAIRMDSGMTEREAIAAGKGQCDAVKRAEILQKKMREDKILRRGACGKDRAAGQ